MAAFGDSFSAVMAAENQQDAMRQAQGNASLSRLLGVLENKNRFQQVKDEAAVRAKEAAQHLAMQQAQLDQQKSQFAQSIQQTDRAFKDKQETDKILADHWERKYATDLAQTMVESGLAQQRINQTATESAPATQFKLGLMKQADEQASRGEFNAAAWKPHVDAGRIKPEEVKYFEDVSKQQFGQRMEQFKQDESVAKLLTREEQLKADLAKKFPNGIPEHWWSSGSKDQYKTLAQQIANIATVTQPYRKDKGFAERFIPTETDKGVEFKPTMTPPRDFSRVMTETAYSPPSSGMGNRAAMDRTVRSVVPSGEMPPIPGQDQPASAAPAAAQPYMGFGASAYPMPPTAASMAPVNLPRVSTRDEYDRIPSGSNYIGRDGRQYRKP